LAAENLQPKPLAIRVAAVTGRSACFLVSHDANSSVARYVIQLCDEIITCLRGYRSISACPHYSPLAAPAASPAPALGRAAARLGLADLLGLAPSVRISVTRSMVNSWRWPRLRREFFRRRFLKAMTLGPRPCSSTSAATEAPATVGAPTVTLS